MTLTYFNEGTKPLTSEAKLLYLDSDYDILKQGDHVICAISGRKIPLNQLKYWSSDHQEAYASAEFGFKRFLLENE